MDDAYRPNANATLIQEHFPQTTGSLGDFNVFECTDIIFVQGLGSTYERTWSKKDLTGREWMWLRDMLPEQVPRSRIFGFKYDSKWYKDPTFVTLRECGKQLLDALIGYRTHRQGQNMCPTTCKRPLILVGHSFGGLVIKQALVLAAHTMEGDPVHEDAFNILKATVGVIFLGTPHLGSELAGPGLLKANLGRWFNRKSNPEILKVLVTDSTTSILPALAEDFRSLLQRDIMKELRLCCFYETKEIDFPPTLVVKAYSACIEGFPSMPMAVNHMQMNKYIPGDAAFRQVVKQLLGMTSMAPNIVRNRFELHTYGSPMASDVYLMLQRWLSSNTTALINRLEQLRFVRHGDTCSWVTSHPIIAQWQSFDSPEALAWIYGKPGSGKSVLAAHIFDHLKSRHVQNIQCWKNMGQELCDSDPITKLQPTCVAVFGQGTFVTIPRWKILGDVVHQILLQYPQNRKLVGLALQTMDTCSSLQHDRVKPLTKLLIDLSTRIGGLWIIFDGFNELENWVSLVELFGSLPSPQVRVLFIGQPHDRPAGKVLDRIRMNNMSLDVTSFNVRDIETFVEDRVSALSDQWPNLRPLQPRILRRLISDCRGMFQWLSLMLETLDSYGNSIMDVENILDDFPAGLQEAYVKVLSRLIRRPETIRRRIRTAILLLTVAQSPLSIDDLTRAVLTHEFNALPLPSHEIGVEANHLVEHLSSLVSIVHLERGFEIFGEGRTKVPCVQVCHSSLTQLLLAPPHILEQYCKAEEFNSVRQFCFSVPEAHQVMAEITLKTIDLSFKPICGCFYEVARQQIAMVAYAWEHWFVHFSSAQRAETNLDLISRAFDARNTIIITVLELLATIGDRILSTDVALGPQSGGLEKIVSLRRLQSSLSDAIDRLKAWQDQLEDAFSAQELMSATRAIDSTQISDGSWRLPYQQLQMLVSIYPLRQSLSALDTQVMSFLKKNPQFLPEFRRCVLPGLRAAESLRRVALDLTMAPVRSDLLMPSVDFGPVVALVCGSFTLNLMASMAMLPENHDREMHYWNIDEDDAVGAAVQYAISEVSFPPGTKDFKKRLKDVRNYNRIDKSQAMVLGTGLVMFKPSGFGVLVYNYAANLWLNKVVRITENTTRGAWALSDPAMNLNRANASDSTWQQTLPTFASAVKAFPKLVLLAVIRSMQKGCQQLAWYGWLLLAWQHQRICLAYTNFSLLIPTLVHRKSWLYAIPAIVLYGLRFRYFHWFGAHMNYQPWHDIKMVASNPTQWIETLGQQTWWDIWVYYRVYFFGFSTSLKANSIDPDLLPPHLRWIGHGARTYLMFWWLTILERSVCAVVNATLCVAAPIAIAINPPITTVAPSIRASIVKRVVVPLSQLSILSTLLVSIRFAFVVLVLYFADEDFAFSQINEAYLVGIILPVALNFVLLLLPIMCELILRIHEHKHPVDAFVTALFATGVVFYLISAFRGIQKDPHDLGKAIAALQRSVHAVKRSTGRDIVKLDEYVEKSMAELTRWSPRGVRNSGLDQASPLGSPPSPLGTHFEQAASQNVTGDATSPTSGNNELRTPQRPQPPEHADSWLAYKRVNSFEAPSRQSTFSTASQGANFGDESRGLASFQQRFSGAESNAYPELVQRKANMHLRYGKQKHV